MSSPFIGNVTEKQSDNLEISLLYTNFARQKPTTIQQNMKRLYMATLIALLVVSASAQEVMRKEKDGTICWLTRWKNLGVSMFRNGFTCTILFFLIVISKGVVPRYPVTLVASVVVLII